MANLIKTFESLSKPQFIKGVLNFTAVPVNDTEHRIAKDSMGFPALLLKAPPEKMGAQIRLEHLEIQHFVRCRITSSSGSIEENKYTVIRCIESDKELSRYFLYSLEPILKILGSNPSFSEIAKVIGYMVELFRALSQAPIKSTSGLWAELFVIRNSSDPKTLLEAWHIFPGEKYDFSFRNQRVEIKSNSQRSRTHHFSFEQLNPSAGCRVVVISLFVERSGGGLSIRDLIAEIRTYLVGHPTLEERLNRVVALTLGSSLREGYEVTFNRNLASESVDLFDVTGVPKITGPIPLEVSDVHFKSDLDKSPRLTREALKNEGGIFSIL